jgi:hypothetical protein
MINQNILNIARKQIGIYFSDLIKDKNIPIEIIEHDLKISKTEINKVLHGRIYSINSLLKLSAYFDTYIEFSSKSIDKSIINKMGDKINDN